MNVNRVGLWTILCAITAACASPPPPPPATPPTPPQTVDGEYHGTSTRFQAEKRTCPHPGLVRFDVIGRAFQFRWDGNTLVDATIGPDGTLSGGAERITLVGRQTNQKIEADVTDGDCGLHFTATKTFCGVGTF
jgi:hypothetical protein